MGLERVFKFNPYHDKAGRFSTADGAESLSLRRWNTSEKHKAEVAMAHYARLQKRKAGEAETEQFKPYNQDPGSLEYASQRLYDETKEWHGNLDHPERKALMDYTGISSDKFNSALGKAGGDLGKITDSDLRERISDAIKGIDSARTPEDMVVFRAVNLKNVGIKDVTTPQSDTGDEEYIHTEMELLSNFTNGVRFTDHSFGSSSISLLQAWSFHRSGRALLMVNVPKGSKAAYMGGDGRSHHEEESELVIRPSSQYRLGGTKMMQLPGKNFKIPVIEAWLEDESVSKHEVNLSSIFKFNPYHDKAGRFASADGAASISFGKWNIDVERKIQILSDHEARMLKAVQAAKKVSEPYSQDGYDLELTSARLVQDTMDWHDSLSPGEQSALKTYSGAFSDTMNYRMGEAKGDVSKIPDTSGLRKVVRNAVKALDKASTPEDMVVFRCINLQNVGLGGLHTPSEVDDGDADRNRMADISDRANGLRFVDHSFGSSSLSLRKAMTFKKPYRAVLMIHVPKGSKAGYIAEEERSVHAGELELVIKPSGSYRLGTVKTVKVPSWEIKVPVIEAWLEGHDDTQIGKQEVHSSSIFKFNPYHDKAGRFTTADGAETLSFGRSRWSIERMKRTVLDHLNRQAKRKSALEASSYKSYHGYDAVKAGAASLVNETRDWYTNDLNNEERNSIINYTGADSSDMNRWLGEDSGKIPTDDSYLAETIRNLHSALDKASTPENLIVYRAVNLGNVGLGSNKALSSLEGTRFTDHAFASTSIDPEVALRFMKLNRAMLELKIPKGSKAGWVGEWDGDLQRSSIPSEMEMIVQKGAKIRLGKVKDIRIPDYPHSIEVIEAELEGFGD